MSEVQEYPKWFYHEDGRSILIQTPDEAVFDEDGWSEHYQGPETAPESTNATLLAKAVADVPENQAPASMTETPPEPTRPAGLERIVNTLLGT